MTQLISIKSCFIHPTKRNVCYASYKQSNILHNRGVPQTLLFKMGKSESE